MRPTSDRVREAWMSALTPRLPGARILDLFAGSGALGLECLSRGASEVVFVEQARPSLTLLRSNIDLLGAGEEAHVIAGDAVAWIRALPADAFDIALADPPYGKGYTERLLHLFRETPFAREFWIEHGTSELSEAFPEATRRRYGDTTLTRIEAPDG